MDADARGMSCWRYFQTAMITHSSIATHSDSQPGFEIPAHWVRKGLVMARSEPAPGEQGSVTGDPCIVWDEEIHAWRMFLFKAPPGHAHSVCTRTEDGIPVDWSEARPLEFEGAVRGTHKPYVVQEAYRPNHAARINGEYWLVSVMNEAGRKYIQRARSTSLAGPWRWDSEPLIPTGEPGSFDEKHTDAVTGFYFPERDAVLYFYMGYPLQAQSSRSMSPFGNAGGLAIQGAAEPGAKKLGLFLPPPEIPGHWASGWVGGFQILPGKRHRWIALLNASPTAPNPMDTSIAREEPAPSLGGWAYCDEAWPVKNWHFEPDPMEWIEQIPASAEGEGVNLWRHHALCLPGGRIAVYYNSGSYGREQLYLKVSQ